MSDTTERGTSREASAERILRDGLEANVLSTEALQRIRQAAEREWRAANPARSRRGSRWPAAVASVAILITAVGGAYLGLNAGPQDGAVLGLLESADAPGLVEPRWLREDLILAEGSSVRAGQTVDARGDALIGLEGGGNLRMARATTVVVEGEDLVRLVRGELYVDIPPGTRARDAFRVMTDAGEFRHEGTQFAIASVDGQTRLRVREGRVLWRAESATAAVDAGTEVLIDRNGNATRRSVATAGRDWAWMESITPEVAIEDRPLIEYLEWFARETGRKLEIDAAARAQAANTRMHGDVHGLTVTEALSAVMATTSLRYELPEGVIRVSSTREPTSPPA